MKRVLSIAALFIAGYAHGFTTDPGPVRNVSVLNHYRHSIEVSYDAPANAAEVKSFFVEWVSTNAVVMGSKMDPYTPGRRVVSQIQPLVPNQEYALRISPVDAEG